MPAPPAALRSQNPAGSPASPRTTRRAARGPLVRTAGLLALPTLALLSLLASCHPGLELDTPLTDAERSFEQPLGELLMARANCTACHAADDATLSRLRPLAAPALGGIGWRNSPEWLADWLDHGCSLRPGSRMPAMFSDLDDFADRERRAEVIDELVHLLMTLGGGFESRPVRAGDWDVERGAELFDTLGCRACHATGVDGDMAAKTDLARMTEFLLDPLRLRPAGAMPDMALAQDEARALSSWVLREQHAAGPSETVWWPGLALTLYELPFWPKQLPDWSALTPLGTRSARRVDVSLAPREDQFGLVFRGQVLVPHDGEHHFFLNSDDGSRLSIDGQVLIDHDGLHGPERKDGSARLSAGWHELQVEMFEAGGGELIDAGFVLKDDASAEAHADADGGAGPSQSDTDDDPGERDGVARSFESGQLRHEVMRYLPRDHKGRVAIDPDKAARGRAQYEARRCGACHALASVPSRRGPDLDALQDLDAGCLAEDVPGLLPDYQWTPKERAALRETLAQRRALRAPLTPAAEVSRALARMDCLACHERDGQGGSSDAVAAAFVGHADLGDEGRLPPDLSGVGGRLRHDWLAALLDEGDSPHSAIPLRPYMTARMPRFGEGVLAGLSRALVAADAAPPAPPEPRPDTTSVLAGRALASATGGLACISCHGLLGHEGTGLPGLDLASTSERMTWPGFHQWLSDPISRRTGTRMPSYFDEGRSVQGNVLDGDAEAQIAALWSWLSLGRDMPLPSGLLVDRADYAQVPLERPLYASVFMQGLSARVLAVGFPERVSLAFDQEHVRLGRLWRGDFLSLEGTWFGRAGELELPAGHSVIELPPGPALALADEPWPHAVGRDAGWRFDGHRRRADGAPIFRMHHETLALRVEEQLSPLFDPGAGHVRRRLELFGADSSRVVLRAALSESISPDGRGGFTTSDGLTIVVSRGTPALRQTTAGTELLVTPDVEDRPEGPRGDATPAHDGVIELELIW